MGTATLLANVQLLRLLHLQRCGGRLLLLLLRRIWGVAAGSGIRIVLLPIGGVAALLLLLRSSPGLLLLLRQIARLLVAIWTAPWRTIEEVGRRIGVLVAEG